MADGVQLTCWPTPDRLGLGVQVRNLAGQRHHPTEEFVQLDTGYSEDLLIPYSLFEALNLQHWQLPHSLAPYGTTVTGQVIYFLEAHAEVMIPQTSERHQVIAQTFVGNTRFLIGRAFIRRFQILLDGPGSQTCLLRPESSEVL